jgi:hypothetical protein
VERRVSIPRELLQEINAEYQAEGRVHVLESRYGRPFSRQYITREIARAGKQELGRRTGVHMLRHSWATDLSKRTRRTKLKRFPDQECGEGRGNPHQKASPGLNAQHQDRENHLNSRLFSPGPLFVTLPIFCGSGGGSAPSVALCSSRLRANRHLLDSRPSKGVAANSSSVTRSTRHGRFLSRVTLPV